MPFNNFLLLLMLVFVPLSNAGTWEEFLKLSMEKSLSVLEEKMERCDANKQVLPKITDDWFMELSKDEKYSAASYLAYLAGMNCFGVELKNYESALLAYSSESKNDQDLQEWLTFSRVYRGAVFEKTFSELDISKLLSWYEKKGEIKPFDKVSFLEQYRGFSK